MNRRTDIWTILIITAISVLVWVWAAGETRISRTLPPIRVEFTVPDRAGWIVSPDEVSVSFSAEGSQRAVGRAGQMTRLTLDLPEEVGARTVDLFEALRHHPDIEAMGISIVATSPAEIEVDLDELVDVTARVRPVLPGVQTVDEIVVTPAQVTVTMPGQLRRFYPDDFTVEAFIDRHELDRLEPGVPHTIENVALRLPEALGTDPALSTSPGAVTLTFTVRSRIRELRMETPVRVKVAGAPEDSELVELDPKQLRDVTISAPVHLIERLESGDAVVVALLHLKSSEKESRITSKPVTCFLVLLPDGSGVVVDARVGDVGETRPVIGVTISGD